MTTLTTTMTGKKHTQTKTTTNQTKNECFDETKSGAVQEMCYHNSRSYFDVGVTNLAKYIIIVLTENVD